jgi:protein gp37
LEEWGALSEIERAHLLAGDDASKLGFNQTNESVEWAWWTWNPVTGCNHGCPYCYARVIATKGPAANAFPNGFAPTLCSNRLKAPHRMKVPADAATDSRWRNVFVCSMADLFGRWVPAEWIEAVLREMAEAPQWNFLCLTKFPKRMAEFAIPENVWMGTTVDLQARVPAAEAGFANVRSKVKWLSLEPMLEPLKFTNIGLFDWVVIGGASAQSGTANSPATPEWRPPFPWIVDVVEQARAAGVKVYFKTNLLGHRILEMPFDAPVKSDPAESPPVFHYLGKSAA